MNKLVAVAMSGGVDSSVAAALLMKQGYRVIGMFLKTWYDKTIDPAAENRCCSNDASRTASRIAHKLGIKFQVINALVPFKELVVDYFLSELKAGRTPNPCVTCNQGVRFEYLLGHARSLGADFLATGHYMRIKKSGRQLGLYRGIDKKKDQSYFHYTLTQSKLKKLLFPIGDYHKSDVRKLARKFGLPAPDRPESQDLCFIPRGKYTLFLKKYLNLRPGPILDIKGRLVGEHQGLPIYTIGQRGGLGIGGNGPYYVIKKDDKNNSLIVVDKNDNENLTTLSFRAKKVNYIDGHQRKTPVACFVQTRYRQKAVPATLKPAGQNAIVEYKKRQPIVTPGQAAVWYKGDQLLGGGIIDS